MTDPDWGAASVNGPLEDITFVSPEWDMANGWPGHPLNRSPLRYARYGSAGLIGWLWVKT